MRKGWHINMENVGNYSSPLSRDTVLMYIWFLKLLIKLVFSWTIFCSKPFSSNCFLFTHVELRTWWEFKLGNMRNWWEETRERKIFRIHFYRYWKLFISPANGKVFLNLLGKTCEANLCPGSRRTLLLKSNLAFGIGVNRKYTILHRFSERGYHFQPWISFPHNMKLKTPFKSEWETFRQAIYRRT